jgi:hypothetical protein
VAEIGRGFERNGLFATVIFRELVFEPWCLIQAWGDAQLSASPS